MTYIPERNSTHVYHVSKINQNEMAEALEKCTYDNPPFCNAACPLKLDTMGMLAAVADGDFDKALKIYEKATPFPKLLASGCEAPCEKQCRLSEIGDGVAINDIEQAIAKYGQHKKGSGVFRTKKKKTTAVIGSDLFALFLAGELEKKMYPVQFYSEVSDMGSFLERIGGDIDPEELSSLDIDFHFSCSFEAAEILKLKNEADVLCISSEVAKAAFPGADVDTDLLYCESNGLVVGPEECGVLASAFAAKRAALSVDRLAQNLHPSNTRGQEGPQETKLYTDLSVAKKLKKIEIKTKEDAIEEASRCIQCHCDECTKSCAFLAHYNKKPALIGREIYNNTQIIMGDHQLTVPMNSCALCGQCTVTCPNGIDMAKICHESKKNMVDTEKMSNAPHEFALLDMLFSNEDAFLSRPQPGYEKCKYAFFPGCQAGAVAPDTVKAVYKDLCNRLEGGVAIMLGCCGAIADWAGRSELYTQQAELLDNELEKLGNPIIIAGCPTCKKQLSRHNPVGIWTILEKIGIPSGGLKLEKAALHDSCGARGDKETQDSIRKIIAECGCELVETPYSGDTSPCCGFGGLVQYANPQIASEMTEKCLERSGETFITYCMACRDRFARQGRQSRHILELVYGSEAKNAPDISEKRMNRLSLKQDLLKEIWNEEVGNVDLGFTVTYTPQAEDLMDKRYILKTDVEAVLSDVNESGAAIFDEESGLNVATKRLGNVTFWVKYIKIDGGYEVHSAYSHRMTVETRA